MTNRDNSFLIILSVTDESFVDETRVWRNIQNLVLVSMMSLFIRNLKHQKRFSEKRWCLKCFTVRNVKSIGLLRVKVNMDCAMFSLYFLSNFICISRKVYLLFHIQIFKSLEGQDIRECIEPL